MITNIKQCIEKSLVAKGPRELKAKLQVTVDNQVWNAYTVAMNHREFTLFCEEGTATYVVDTYGDKSTCELFDWEPDEDNKELQ